MALSNRVSVTVTDVTKQSATMSYDFKKTLGDKITPFKDSQYEQLSKLVDDYSYAKATKATQSIVYDNYTPPTAAWYKPKHTGTDLVDQKAVITLREKSTGDVHIMSLPAPKESLFDYVDGAGLRVKQDKGEAIAKKMSDILGVTVVFVRGHHKGRK